MWVESKKDGHSDVYTSIHGPYGNPYEETIIRMVSRFSMWISVLALMGYMAPAFSDNDPHEYTFILNGPTLHISPNRYNRSTWGAGIGYSISKNCFFAIGRYNNSIEIPSNYVGVSCFKEYSNNLVLEAGVGTITGYYSHPVPFIFPAIGAKIGDNARILFTVLPPMKVIGALTINGRLEVNF